MENESQKELDSHSAVRYHWQVWKFMGLIQTKGLFLLQAIVLNILATFLFPLTLLAKLLYTFSLQDLCENLSITITDIAANVKFLNVLRVRQQLVKIRQLLQKLDSRATSVNNAKELAVLHQSVKTARSSFSIFAGIFIFGTALSCIRVMVAQKRQLLYPAFFGIDWHTSNVAYVVICGYQLFGLIIQAMQACANDSYPPAYLTLLTGHMRALELRVRRVGYPASILTRSLAHWRRSVYFELNACIEDYLDILRLHGIIQEVLSVPCIVQFISSGMVQCTVAMHFLYVVDSNDISSIILSLVFFFAVTLEVLIICYFGDEMRAQSEALMDAFYSCNWLDQLPYFRRNLIFTMMRLQHACYIYAGGYLSVTLETFVQVMRFTYSTFTVLLRMKQN